MGILESLTIHIPHGEAKVLIHGCVYMCFYIVSYFTIVMLDGNPSGSNESDFAKGKQTKQQWMHNPRSHAVSIPAFGPHVPIRK